MNNEANIFNSRQIGSSSQISSVGTSLRRRSLSLSGTMASEMDSDIESEKVSEVGDIGDRALHSSRHSENGSLHFTVDNVPENGVVVPLEELQSGHFYGEHPMKNPSSPVSPLPSEISPLSTCPMVNPAKKDIDNTKALPLSLEYISCLIHLAVFGILGVFTRHLLKKLFGPGVAGVTNDQSILYLDLPSNMVGSFLMGWLGVVYKGEISRISDQLTIGLTTGYLGSLTTFSGWNQNMLELSVEGKWVYSMLGFFLGLFLAAYSIIFGVETAKGFRWLLTRLKASSENGSPCFRRKWRVESFRCHLTVLMVVLLILGLLWGVSGTFWKSEFSSCSSEAPLWLACLVGPAGVWIRWYLARLNGRGLGKAGMMKWVPFGTLAANIAAGCIMAALATLKKVVNTRSFDTVATGIQLGFLGCLSTVSTFIAEFNAMRESVYPWRAYAYAAITIVPSFLLGTLIYSVPVWSKGYG